MSRVVKFYKYGGPEVLKAESIDRLELGPSEVRVRMKALALNRANAMFREGNYLVNATFPSRIGTEGAGFIEVVGEGVTDFNIFYPCSTQENSFPSSTNRSIRWNRL